MMADWSVNSPACQPNFQRPLNSTKCRDLAGCCHKDKKCKKHIFYIYICQVCLMMWFNIIGFNWLLFIFEKRLHVSQHLISFLNRYLGQRHNTYSRHSYRWPVVSSIRATTHWGMASHTAEGRGEHTEPKPLHHQHHTKPHWVLQSQVSHRTCPHC